MKQSTVLKDFHKVLLTWFAVLGLTLSCSPEEGVSTQQYLLVYRRQQSEGVEVPGFADSLSLDDPLALLDVAGGTLQELPDFPVFALESRVLDPSSRLNLTWSPDGHYVLYVASVTSPGNQQNREIFRADADGSHVVNLTNNPAADELPTWSPDGQYIAFTSGRDTCGPDRSFEDRGGNPHDLMTGCARLYIMHPDGSEVRLATEKAGITGVSWSPDSRQLVVQTGTSLASPQLPPRVYVVSLDDNAEKELFDIETTSNSLDVYCDSRPSWSPDGSYIYLALMNDYLIHPNGRGLRRLLPSTVDADNDCVDVWFWSPDGESMASYLYEKGLVAVNVESGVLDHLGHAGLSIETGQPATYAPDGMHLIFQGYSGEGKYDIYSLAIESGELVNLTAQYPESFMLIDEWVMGIP